MARRILAGGLAAFFALGAILWVPWATEKRTVTASTPVPPPLFGVTPAPVPAGKEACLQQVTLTPETEVGQFAVVAGPRGGPPLTVRASGKGYRHSARVPGGYTTTGGALMTPLQFQLEPPRSELIGEVCIRNDGEREIDLVATTEFRTMGRPTLVIDGAPQPFDAHLVFYEREQATYLGRIGEIFDNAAAFTPPAFGPLVIGLLALIALIGIPAGLLGALAVSVRDEERDG